MRSSSSTPSCWSAIVPPAARARRPCRGARPDRAQRAADRRPRPHRRAPSTSEDHGARRARHRDLRHPEHAAGRHPPRAARLPHGAHADRRRCARRRTTAASSKPCCTAPTTRSPRCRKASSSRPTPPGSNCSATRTPAALVGQPVMDLFDAGHAGAAQGRAGGLPAGPLERPPAQGRMPCSPTARACALELVLAAGEFEGEPCVQLIVPAQQARRAAARAPSSPTRCAATPTTGLWQRRHLLRAVQRSAWRRRLRGGVRCLACIRPDKFRDAGAPSSASTATEEFLAAVRRRRCARMLGPNDLAGHFGAREPAGAARARQRARRRGLEREPGRAHRAARASSSASAGAARPARVGLALVANADARPRRRGVAMALAAARRGAERGGNQVVTSTSASTRTRACWPTTRSGSSTSGRR